MRKEYLRVEEIAITRLNNAEYIGLMQRVLKRLPRKQSSSGGSEEDGPQVQSVEPRTGEVVDELYIDAELVEELQACIDELNNLTFDARRSLATAELEELDRQRDLLVAYMISASKQASALPFATKSKAGKELYVVLEPFTGIRNKAYRSETVLVNNMLNAIEKKGLTAHLTTLGLDETFAELKRLNDLFEETSAERSGTAAPKRLEERSREIRARADKLYREIADRAFAANLLFPTEETENFIVQLNNELLEAEADYNRRMGKGDSEDSSQEPADKPSTDGTETPGGQEKPSEEQETPSTGGEENPSTEEPTDPETPGGETTEPDDRPVVQ